MTAKNTYVLCKDSIQFILRICFCLLHFNGFAQTERAHVFFVHGANIDLNAERIWARKIFKCLYLSGAHIEFFPVSWESNLGPNWNYHANVSNAFEMAQRFANQVNAFSGRNIVIAHSLGTVLAASAIQDYGAHVEKLIMLNSSIPAEAFDPSLSNWSATNHLVHAEWANYPSRSWCARWHELFNEPDARSKLTWRGRFINVTPYAVNFYSSGDEVLEIYSESQNPAWYNGISSSGAWGRRFSWHKQEIWKGRKSFLGFMGTTDWSGWGFALKLVSAPGAGQAQFVPLYSPQTITNLTDEQIRTLPAFQLTPEHLTNSVNPRLILDYHLALGIPALSPATGRTHFSTRIMPSFDLNTPEFMTSTWPVRENQAFNNRFLHSDIKDMPYFYTHRLFEKIVELGGLK